MALGDPTAQDLLEIRQLRLMTPQQQQDWLNEVPQVVGEPDAHGYHRMNSEWCRRSMMIYKAEWGDDAEP